jgi:hypothetical protein
MPRRKLTLPDNWRDFLADVDAALSQRFRLRCLGGFVLAALYELHRPTEDMDYIEIMPRDKEPKLMEVAGPQSKLAKRHRLCIHRAAISQYPYACSASAEIGESVLSVR